jgi:hypothetical protein
MDALRKSVKAERGATDSERRGKSAGRRSGARAATKRKKLRRAS